MYRTAITILALCLMLATANDASAGCRGGRGRRVHGGGCAPASYAPCGATCAPCSAAHVPACGQPQFPVAHAAGQVLTAPVRLFTGGCSGGKCGP